MAKKLKVFLLIDTSELKDSSDIFNTNILTICERDVDCFEYLGNYLYLQHQEHYKSWCNLRKKDYKSKDSWKEYVSSCLGDELLNNYNIFPAYINAEMLCLLMRMYKRCIPLGCSFEHEIEEEVMLETTKEVFKKLFNSVEVDEDTEKGEK